MQYQFDVMLDGSTSRTSQHTDTGNTATAYLQPTRKDVEARYEVLLMSDVRPLGSTRSYREQAIRCQQTKDMAMGKILIIVDDAECCEIFSKVLEDAGHVVKMLQSSAELFRVLPRFVPDIVLVDMTMPGISTFLTLSFIRRLSDLMDTRIILIANPLDTAKSAKSLWRADVVLTKPVSPDQLLETVSTYL